MSGLKKLMKRIPVLASLILLLIIGPSALAELNKSADPTILINKKEFTLSELKKRIKPERIIIEHQPAYNGKQKIYYGFAMKPFLNKFLNVNLQKNISNKILLAKTTDRYLGKIPLSFFNSNNNAYLVFEEDPKTIDTALSTPDKRWSYIQDPKEQVSPGPFYIVWDNPETYPTGWPYGVVSLQIVDESQFTVNFLKPEHTTQNIKKGYDIFQNVCSSCHSLYYHGQIGRAPDLGVVTQYLPHKDISQIIKNGKGYMPPIGKFFTQQEILDTINYLAWVSQKSAGIQCQFSK